MQTRARNLLDDEATGCAGQKFETLRPTPRRLSSAARRPVRLGASPCSSVYCAWRSGQCRCRPPGMRRPSRQTPPWRKTSAALLQSWTRSGRRRSWAARSARPRPYSIGRAPSCSRTGLGCVACRSASKTPSQVRQLCPHPSTETSRLSKGGGTLTVRRSCGR